MLEWPGAYQNNFKMVLDIFYGNHACFYHADSACIKNFNMISPFGHKLRRAYSILVSVSLFQYIPFAKVRIKTNSELV